MHNSFRQQSRIGRSNEVTWYSKVLTLLVLAGLIVAAFVVGREFGRLDVQPITSTLSSVMEDRSTTTDVADGVGSSENPDAPVSTSTNPNGASNNDGGTVSDDGQSSPYERSEDGFQATAEYVGESTWEYTVTGTLPNPCYDYDLEVTVMESQPEQVRLAMSITPPAEGQVCAQVIQEVNESGTYPASAEANFNFAVENNE